MTRSAEDAPPSRRGKLAIIPTPIGNLDDLSARARNTLRDCSVLFCEDTRHTGKLLGHFGIDTVMLSLHEHNEDQRIGQALERLENGERIGLVSDAGTPLVSDPGYRLVRSVIAAGFAVEPLPGPFAGVVALTASGIPPQPFAFFGFPPHRKGERRSFYREIARLQMTSIVFEAPTRLAGSLEDALEELGDVDVALGREITKMHEEFVRGTLREVLAEIQSRERIRGEVTIVFAAARPVESSPPDADRLRVEFDELLANGLRRGDAVRELADRHRMRRNQLYRLLETRE